MTEKQVFATGSITVAENTQQEPLRLLVDWVSVSFYFASPLAELCTFIGIPELEFKEANFVRYQGYSVMYTWDKIEIMHNPETDKYFLNLSGQGCRQFETESTLEWDKLFSLLLDYCKATFTRLDFAIDDFNRTYTVNTIRNAVFKKTCVTKLKTWDTKQSGHIQSGKDYLTMDLFQLGNATSRYMIVFYDKYLEQLFRQQKEPTVKSWTRTEIRFKDDYATLYATYLSTSSKDMNTLIFEILNEKLAFLRPNVTDTNRSRAAQDKNNHSRWWRKFIGNVQKTKLSMQAPDYSLDKSKAWLEKSVAPTLAMLKQIEDLNYEDYLQKLLYLGTVNLKQKHINTIESENHFTNKKKTRPGMNPI